jgi:hypothetical protein
MKAISAMEGDEDKAEFAKVLKQVYSKVAKPTDSVMELQLDSLCDKYPGAADHKPEIIATAKKHGITVKEAYFMRYGEEAASAPKNDLLREVELQKAAMQNSTARVDPGGNVPPGPVKKKQTVKVTRSEAEMMRRLGITPQQYAQAMSHQGAYSGDMLSSIFGKEGGVKKG